MAISIICSVFFHVFTGADLDHVMFRGSDPHPLLSAGVLWLDVGRGCTAVFEVCESTRYVY